MAIQVKDLAASAEKWVRNAGAAATEYSTNAQAAATRWAANAQAAQQTYQQGVSAPNVPQRYARGIAKAGAAKYQRRVEAVGLNRYTEGVGVAKDDWQAGFQPFAQRLAALTLPPRRPRGDRANYRRVEEVGIALNAQRLAALGGSS